MCKYCRFCSLGRSVCGNVCGSSTASSLLSSLMGFGMADKVANALTGEGVSSLVKKYARHAGDALKDEGIVGSGEIDAVLNQLRDRGFEL